MNVQDGMDKNLEQHVYIERQVQEIKFGTITMTMRVHEGRVEDITLQVFKRIKFDKPKKDVIRSKHTTSRVTAQEASK